MDSTGTVYVADYFNSRIQKFNQVDNCTATLSDDLSLHVPIAKYFGQPYALDFQWNGVAEA